MGDTPATTSHWSDAFMTPEEVARCLGVRKNTLYYWLRKGLIRHHRMSRTIRVRQGDLLEFVKRCERTGCGLEFADQEWREAAGG